MSAFLFAHSTVNDTARFELYREASADSVARYGGRLLLAGVVTDVLEGTHANRRAVVFEFPDVEAIRAWYRSPEYRQVVGLRSGTGEFNLIVVDSF
jgi:uncharacterized protein (DUF1330 family)